MVALEAKSEVQPKLPASRISAAARSGHFTQVTEMGRLNHENSIVVPNRAGHDSDSSDHSSDSDSSDDSSGRRGWRHHVVLTTDDTFSGPSAQLYMYLARRRVLYFFLAARKRYRALRSAAT